MRISYWSSDVCSSDLMSDLLLHHARHKIGHRPHALADLGMALKAAGKADIDVPVLIVLDPSRRLDRILVYDGACLHRGVDFVARPVDNAGVVEAHPVPPAADAGRLVCAFSPLFAPDSPLPRFLAHAPPPPPP